MTVEDIRKKRSTISDVAERAGVAIGTVSRYMNGQEIRKGNRQQIEEAIEALGFRRNAAAMAMKNARTGIIGFLVPTFDEFHAELLGHLARIFRQTNHTMLTYCHEDDTRLLNEAMNFFVGQQVDALVMAGLPEATELLTPYTDNDIPVVIYNNDVRGPRVDRVFVDNIKASIRAVSHLIDTGHPKVALCAGRDIDTSGSQRRTGYELALKKRGLPLREDYVVYGDWSVEGGYSAAQSLMSLSDPPTAIFSASYRMTIGILEWMREHGLRTPQDLAIVSFDDVDLFRLYDEGITAVAQPIGQIAEAIASYVGSRINNPEVADIRSRTLECNIILRGSSGQPA
jgi:LacI family transcriptional regulator